MKKSVPAPTMRRLFSQNWQYQCHWKAPLEENDFKSDSFGLELNRQTITGEWDELYKSLIEMAEGIHLSDDDYFQKYLKAHLDRGARMIYSEFRYNSDFLLALLSEKTSI